MLVRSELNDLSDTIYCNPACNPSKSSACKFINTGSNITGPKGSVFNHSSLLMNHHRSCLLSLLQEMQSAVRQGKQEEAGWGGIIPSKIKDFSSPVLRNISSIRHTVT